jgi:hypothetical protein
VAEACSGRVVSHDPFDRVRGVSLGVILDRLPHQTHIRLRGGVTIGQDCWNRWPQAAAAHQT